MFVQRNDLEDRHLPHTRVFTRQRPQDEGNDVGTEHLYPRYGRRGRGLCKHVSEEEDEEDGVVQPFFFFATCPTRQTLGVELQTTPPREIQTRPQHNTRIKAQNRIKRLAGLLSVTRRRPPPKQLRNGQLPRCFEELEYR